MRPAPAIAAALALGAAACGGYGERYPSYDAIVAQYASGELYVGEPLDPALAPECDAPDCDCPAVFYDDHWVYYCGGRWVYWNAGLWYTYPVFYAYWTGGVPYPATGPVRSITKSPPGPGHGGAHGGAHAGGPPAATGSSGASQPGPPPPIAAPRPQAPAPAPAPPKRADPPPPPPRRR